MIEAPDRREPERQQVSGERASPEARWTVAPSGHAQAQIVDGVRDDSHRAARSRTRPGSPAAQLRPARPRSRRRSRASPAGARGARPALPGRRSDALAAWSRRRVPATTPAHRVRPESAASTATTASTPFSTLLRVAPVRDAVLDHGPEQPAAQRRSRPENRLDRPSRRGGRRASRRTGRAAAGR